MELVGVWGEFKPRIVLEHSRGGCHALDEAEPHAPVYRTGLLADSGPHSTSCVSSISMSTNEVFGVVGEGGE